MLSQKYKLHLILGLNHVLLTYCKFCFLHLSCESLFEEGNLLSPDHKLSIYSAEWMISLLLNLANFFFLLLDREMSLQMLCFDWVLCLSCQPESMQKVNANPPKLFFNGLIYRHFKWHLLSCCFLCHGCFFPARGEVGSWFISCLSWKLFHFRKKKR